MQRDGGSYIDNEHSTKRAVRDTVRGTVMNVFSIALQIGARALRDIDILLPEAFVLEATISMEAVWN